jgi:signal transduction histidine kinase
MDSMRYESRVYAPREGTDAYGGRIGTMALDTMEGLLAEWRAMVDAIASLIVVIDEHGIILRCNRALMERLGRPFQVIIGRSRDEVLGKWLGFPDDCWELSAADAMLPLTVRANEHWFDVRTYPFAVGRDTVCGCVHVLVDVTRRVEAEQALARHREHLRALIAQLTRAEVRAREQVAIDLHDGLGATLALAKLKLDTLCADTATTGGLPAAEVARDQIAAAVRFTRELTSDLFPPFFDELGLVPVAQALVERLSAQHGVHMRVSATADVSHLTGDIARAAYQSLRELLVNVIKHAHATQAMVRFSQVENQLIISVKDDGCGFTDTEMTDDLPSVGKFGLFSLRERITLMGGSLCVAKAPKHGSCVTLTLPLEESGKQGGVHPAHAPVSQVPGENQHA